MLILFIISVVSFVALVGAGVAMARHVWAGQKQERTPAPPQPEFKQHFQSAVRYGSPNDLRQVRHQKVESIATRKEWNAPWRAAGIHLTGENEIDNGRRKSPQTESTDRGQVSGDRLDWTHNKDYGDITAAGPSRLLHAASGRAASRRRY